MEKLRFKKLYKGVKTPLRGTEHSAGIDLYAHTIMNDLFYDKVTIGTGIAVEIPEGHVGLLFPRSSISNTALRLSNSVGVIDSDYRGEISFKFDINDKLSPNSYDVGDRCGQLVIMPIKVVELEEVSYLSKTKRGQGGYGSTGKK